MVHRPVQVWHCFWCFTNELEVPVSSAWGSVLEILPGYFNVSFDNHLVPFYCLYYLPHFAAINASSFSTIVCSLTKQQVMADVDMVTGTNGRELLSIH